MRTVIASLAQSVPVAFISNQCLVWGARAIVLIQSNPFTFAITCVALAAIGTVFFIFRRMRSSEITIQILSQKVDISEAKLGSLLSKISQIEVLTEKVEFVENECDYLEGVLETSQENLETFKKETLEKFQARFLEVIEDVKVNVKRLEDENKLTANRLNALEAPKNTGPKPSNLKIKEPKISKLVITKPLRPLENRISSLVKKEIAMPFAATNRVPQEANNKH